AEALLVDELRGHRHREVRAAVERAVEHDNPGAPGRGSRDLDGVLDRLGAGVQQEGLRRRLAGPQLVEPLRDRDVRLVGADHEALVQLLVDLLVDRAPASRAPVAEVLAGDAAAEVEVLATLAVPGPGTPGARDDELGARDAPRHESIACLAHAVAGNPMFDPQSPGRVSLPECEG